MLLESQQYLVQSVFHALQIVAEPFSKQPLFLSVYLLVQLEAVGALSEVSDAFVTLTSELEHLRRRLC